MSAPDVSAPGSVAEAVAPDAFDARPDAFGALAVDRGGPAGGRGSLGKTRRARGQAKDANALSAEGVPGYLVVFGVVVRCPIERRAVEELLPALRPVIDDCLGTALDLASLTLTSPDEGTIREKVEAFVAQVARAPGEGALLVRGIGRKGERRTHFHGLLLALNVPGCCNEWRSLARAEARGAVAKTITGWPGYRAGEYDRRFLPNLARVVGYDFEPLPSDMPPRDLDADVIASGPLAARWKASRAALEAPPRLALDGPGKASAKRRKCAREKCGQDFPPRKRSHAKFCSDGCRKAASDERTGRNAKRGRARGEAAREPSPREEPSR